MKKPYILLSLWLLLGCTPQAGRHLPENTLTPEEKVAGLSALWAEAKYNEAFFETIGTEKWDSAYRTFIRPVMDTPNDYLYYRQLQRFCALLHDGHSRVYYRKAPVITTFFDQFQWYVSPIEGKAIVSHINQRMKDEIPVGSEIVEVNGMPTAEYLEKEVIPYISSSTDYVRHDMAVQTMFTSLQGDSYHVKIQTPAGKQIEKKITHEILPEIENDPMYPASPAWHLIEMKWYPGQIAYVALNSFKQRELIDSFAVRLPELKKAKKLIIDLRQNGGGQSDVSEEIMSHLTFDKELTPPIWCTRVHSPAYMSWGRRATAHDTVNNPFMKKVYEVSHRIYYEYGDPDRIHIPAATERIVVPTVLLTGHGTASAAEDFLILADKQPHITKIGQPSNGSTGNPILFPITEDLGFQICSKKDLYPDGRPFVGYGVQPDIEVIPTVQDLIDGYDRTLQTALDYLSNTDAPRP